MQISHRWHSAAYLTQSTIVLKKIQPQHFFATWPTSPCGAPQCGSCWQNAKKSRKGLMIPKMQGGTLPINMTPMVAVFLLLLCNVVALAYPLTALGLPKVKHHQTPKIDFITLANSKIQQVHIYIKAKNFSLEVIAFGAPGVLHHKTVILGSLLCCFIGTVFPSQFVL